jgi:ATP-dependent Clp protease adaptor protein ClpS
MSDNPGIDQTALINRPRSNSAARTSKPKTQPPYAVIVHNDEEHTQDYVIEVLQRVCGHPLGKAVQLTSQVHTEGQANVWSGSLEVAELKRDQIRGFGPDFYSDQTVRFPLGVTIELLPGD